MMSTESLYQLLTKILRMQSRCSACCSPNSCSVMGMLNACRFEPCPLRLFVAVSVPFSSSLFGAAFGSSTASSSLAGSGVGFPKSE